MSIVSALNCPGWQLIVSHGAVAVPKSSDIWSLRGQAEESENISATPKYWTSYRKDTDQSECGLNNLHNRLAISHRGVTVPKSSDNPSLFKESESISQPKDRNSYCENKDQSESGLSYTQIIYLDLVLPSRDYQDVLLRRKSLSRTPSFAPSAILSVDISLRFAERNRAARQPIQHHFPAAI